MTERRNRDILLLIVGLSALLLLAGCSSVAKDAPVDRFRDLPPELNKQDPSVRSTGSTGQGDVQIDLTPHDFKDGILEVDIAANTHSVDLGQFDLESLATLEIGGQEFRPTEAPSLSGHHAGGTLVFDPQTESDTFTITIIGIPQSETRIYRWGS